MLFSKNKKYKLSYSKYKEDCDKNGVEIVTTDNWAYSYNGAHVTVKDDLTMGIIHVYVGPPKVVILNGRPMQAERERDARLVIPEWCEEVAS